MNKHTKEVAAFMKSTPATGRPSKAKVLAKFEDKYGDEKVIHLTRSGLRVKRNESTVILTINARVAELVSQNIRQRRLELGLTLEEVAMRAGITSTTPKCRMWEIENNTAKAGLRMGTLYALAIGLECSPCDLLPSISEVLAGARLQTVTEKTLKVMP